MYRNLTLPLILIALLTLNGSFASVKGAATANTNAPIKHLVGVSFDHYFGTYPTNPLREPKFTANRHTPSVNGLSASVLNRQRKLDPPAPPDPGGQSFSFGAAGDFGDASLATETAAAMVRHGVNLFIGEGDYCYCSSDGEWWTSVMRPLSSSSSIISKGSEGNHEVDDSHGGNDLAQMWGMGSFKEQSFDFKNTHFVFLPEDSATPDPNWLDKDLAAARANSAIKWIVVVFHEPIYTSGSDHVPDENGIKSTVLPLIDKYHVDLVLQGHNHNYQRMFGMKNNAVTDRPDANGNYQSPQGTIYMVIGTGGEDNYAFKNQASYVVKQFTNDHGFVGFQVTDQTITGTYYSDSGDAVKDSFSITH